MSAFYLVIYIWAGAMAKGDSVTLVSIPQSSLAACESAGNASNKLVAGTSKSLRYICIKN